MMKQVFFIIPVYKVEAYLRRCVDSVLAQSYKGVKIVLVDDGSPDACPRICDEYAAQYENITVIHKENGGLSDARNAGLLYLQKHAAPTDYLTFLDSDDFVHPDYARKLLTLCEENNCRLAQCAYEKGSDSSFPAENSASSVRILSAQDALLGYEFKSIACAKLYRADTFRDILFPVGVINEDEFVTYRAAYNAGYVALSSEKLLYYFQREDSIMDNVAKKVKNNPHRYDYFAHMTKEPIFLIKKAFLSRFKRPRKSSAPI